MSVDASSRLSDRFQRALSVVTHARLIPLPRRTLASGQRGWTLPAPAPLRARGVLRGCGLDVTIIVEWLPGDLTYSPVYSAIALVDRFGTELLAFHHHPGSVLNTPTFPHLHVSASLRPAQADGVASVVPLDKRHIPTGEIGLPEIVRMLIEEFEVEPLAGNWRERIGLEDEQ